MRLRQHRMVRLAFMLFAVLVVMAAVLFALNAPSWTWVALLVWLLAAWVLVGRHIKSLTIKRLIHYLNERHSVFQDSADLWAHEADESDTNPLREQQRIRVQNLFQADMLDDLHATWRWQPVFWSLLLAALLFLAVVVGASVAQTSGLSTSSTANQQSSEQPAWSWDGWVFTITPPAYTQQAPSTQSTPDIQAWQGSEVLVTQPNGQSWRSVQMHQVVSKQQVSFTNTQGAWQAAQILNESTLWRIHVQDEAGQTLISPQFVWQARMDQPPRIDVEEPRAQFTEVTESPTSWPFALSVQDDLGVTNVLARVAFSEGSGENIQYTTTEHTLTADQTQPNQYTFVLPFDQPLPKGQEVVVRFVATDGRTPEAQSTESSAYVLRWAPDDTTKSADMEGVLRVSEPAAFRSQRQIIIDTEALIEAWDSIDQDVRDARAAKVGLDQRILRNRYGQHLGMEADEGGPLMPVSAEEIAHASGDDHHDHGHDHDHQEHDDHEHEEDHNHNHDGHDHDHQEHDDHEHEEDHGHDHDGHADHDEHDHEAHDKKHHDDHDAHDDKHQASFDPHAGHDHGGELSVNATMQDMVKAFGHTHDHSEAATLFDPETRALLKQAVGAMWQSELALRQTNPKASLPHQHEALIALKKVQQAERIYLARTGLDLPQIDFERRLKKEPESLMVSPIEQPLPAPKPLPLNALAAELSVHLATHEAFTRSPDAWADLLQNVTQAMNDADTDDVVRLRVLGALDELRHQPNSHAAKTQALQALWGTLTPAKHTPQRAQSTATQPEDDS